MKTQESIGKLVDVDSQRDAVHIAVAPVYAASVLSPGQHVGLLNGEASVGAEGLVGIVDPFLIGPVLPGERFWLFLYPNTIESLRHDWAHPAFPRIWPGEASPPPDDDVAGARAEIEAIAADMGQRRVGRSGVDEVLRSGPPYDVLSPHGGGRGLAGRGRLSHREGP